MWGFGRDRAQGSLGAGRPAARAGTIRNVGGDYAGHSHRSIARAASRGTVALRPTRMTYRNVTVVAAG